MSIPGMLPSIKRSCSSINRTSYSYCNSILQCLYHSVPFREAVVNYPMRTPHDSLETALSKSFKYQSPTPPSDTETQQAAKQRPANNSSNGRSPSSGPNQPQKPEDKDSSDYKKKMALQTFPLLETKDNSDSYGMSESLLTALKDIFESIAASPSRIGIVRPVQFLEVLRREHEMFRTAMHQDAHEFLNLVLNEVVANVEAEEGEANNNNNNKVSDSLAEHLTGISSKPRNTSRWVHELFEGTLTSETQCLTCENVSQRDEVFLDLSVDLEQHSSVTSCLRKFSTEEMLCERNKFHCDNCGGLQEAEKRMKIKRSPRILALHLKRFKYTEDLQRLQKLFHRVVYPYHLRLFNTTDDAEDPDRLYELYAVVVHIGGGPYHGHYVSIIKTQDRGWLLFDDELVEPVDKSYVCNFFGDRPGLACAYVLFYRETTLEAVIKEQEVEDSQPPPAEMQAPVPAATTEASDAAATSPSGYGLHPPPAVLSEEAKRSPPTPVLQPEPELPSSPTAPLMGPPPTPPVAGVSALPTPQGLNRTKSNIHLKLHLSNAEERERKVAEKEKERNEKIRRKEMEAKNKEEHRREEADFKAAVEASRASKDQEDRRSRLTPTGAGGNGDGGAEVQRKASTLDMLRRKSKSVSYGNKGIGQILTKEKEKSPTETEQLVSTHESPPFGAVAEPLDGNGHHDDNKNNNSPRIDSPKVDGDDASTNNNNMSRLNLNHLHIHKRSAADSSTTRNRRGSSKWKSFSFRRKSFGVLS